MLALDASVLAYAVNRFAPEHPRATRVVEDLANGDVPWAVPWPAIHEFLGFVTHPHAVARPLGAADAWAFVERLLASPVLRVLGPTDRHGAVLSQVLSAAPGLGLDLHGLETAVVLREHGVRELVSTDPAMRRFPFLSVRDPVHGRAWSPDAPPARRYRVLRGDIPRG
jgi:predicted nucleic acid-binding protein